MRRISLILIGLLMPVAAAAMQQTIFDFREGRLNGTWSISGVDVPQSSPKGLTITTTQDWSIVGAMRVPHATEVVSFTFTNDRPTEARMLWRRQRDPDGTFVQLPFFIPVGTAVTTDVNVDAYGQWDRHAEQVGFALPAGASVTLHDVRLSHWSPMEKAAEAWKSFWMFDHIGPYSINFLWGPVLTFNPAATRELFTTMPPRGRSANWVFYGILALMGAGIALTSKSLRTFLLCFGILWIIYDIRMGAEFLRYAKTDYETFLSRSVGERMYRTYANFPDIVKLSEPFLRPKETFAFLSPPNTPFIAQMRYFAYPSVPVVPAEPSGLRTWVVFDRSDIALSPDGRLVVGGVPLSEPGTVVKRLDDFSFIFQTTAP